MTKKLRRPDMQYLDGNYSFLKGLIISVKNKEEAADVREQIIEDQKLRTDFETYRKSLDDIEDHDEVNLKDDIDRILGGKKPL